MAKIDKGVVDDGSSGLSVAGGVSVGSDVNVGGNLNVTGSCGGVSPGPLPTQATLGNTNTALTVPGFYKYGAGTTGAASQCTGTMPSAATYPGALFMFSPVAGTGGGMFLTGSAPAGATTIFTFPSGSFGQDSSVLTVGGKITVPNSGSIALQSNGFNWMHVASTSTPKLAT